MSRSTLTAIALAVSVAAPPAGAATVADTFTSFWVFGDSLSDTGNIAKVFPGFPPPPYFQNRLSDGPVWTDSFLGDFAPGRSGNFAVAAAAATPNPGPIPDFADQVAAFEAAPVTLGARPLAAVWFGANDVFATISAAGADLANAAAIVSGGVSGAIGGLAAGIDRLVQAGVGSIALFNLPDLGATPRLAGVPGAPALGAGVTDAFNDALALLAGGLRQQGVEVYEVDINGLFAEAVADPGAFGLTEVAEACLPVEPFALLTGAATLPEPCDTPETYLFWDALHPTAAGHAEVARAFDAAVPAIPLPAPALLLLGGLGALAALRRRAA